MDSPKGFRSNDGRLTRFLPDLKKRNKMDIREELIKYAKWYDRATQPEDAQTDIADLVQNVDSYLQTEGKNLVNVPVMRSVCEHRNYRQGWAHDQPCICNDCGEEL